METACLRIKFTPLLQNLQKDSNHCLEIIPEITYIQNLDKIQWRKEENYIEYTVPITYKIILRKKEITNKEDLNRTYYSCVDLLVSSSDTNLKLNSDDIKRILSDTVILNNITTDIENYNIILKDHNKRGKEDEKQAEVQTDINSDSSDTHKISLVKSFKSLDAIQKIDIVQTDPPITSSEADDSEKLKFDYTNSNNVTMESSTNVVKPYENQTTYDRIFLKTISQSSTIKNKIDSLSVTPVYSIDLDDNILFREKSSLEDIVKINDFSSNTHNATRNDYYLYYDILNIHTEIYKPIQEECLIASRVLPEVRVAKIIQQMEREIRPLQVMLSDIINKCMTLGFHQRKRNGNEGYCKNQINKCSNILNKTKTNRVVYSIVFNG